MIAEDIAFISRMVNGRRIAEEMNSQCTSAASRAGRTSGTMIWNRFAPRVAACSSRISGMLAVKPRSIRRTQCKISIIYATTMPRCMFGNLPNITMRHWKAVGQRRQEDRDQQKGR